MELFFGTGNKNKLREIREMLGDAFTLRSIQDLDHVPEVEETGDTLEANAKLKAKAFHEITGLPCFADDTGLEIAALNGAPGVYSARYAGAAGDSEANMRKVLSNLEKEADRSAAFKTVIALYDGTGFRVFEGEMKGTIAQMKRGEFGFGYDPIFIPENSSRHLAEFLPEEKKPALA